VIALAVDFLFLPPLLMKLDNTPSEKTDGVEENEEIEATA